MDEIRIRNLEVYAYHGVFSQEKKSGQQFFLNAVLYTDLRKAGCSDRLADSTDYGNVCKLMDEAMKERRFDLIESAAEYVAKQVLCNCPLIKSIELEVCKPNAPVPLPFESVSVKIRRGWHTVYVALGSNLGDSAMYLRRALRDIAASADVKEVRWSSFIKTKPYGVTQQPDFLNAAACVQTLLSPTEFLDFLHELENKAGRVRKEHWGPRTLDLDILFYDDLVMDSEELTIPHADMANREFVLAPLAEIAPCMRHPLLHKTVKEMLAELGKVQK